MQPTISRSIEIAADPHAVWAAVSDLPRMGRFSPENAGGQWMPPHAGPAPGARFRGTNRNGRKQWWTRVRVVACEPGRVFTFDVRTPFGIRVSRWSYEVVPTETGSRVTEHWYRIGHWLVRRIMGPKVTGRADRPGFNAWSIEQTLANLKNQLESRVHPQ